MSKSIGNVISPYDLVEKYGTDATRYLLLRHVHPTEDTDVTHESLDEWYEANLVNGLGNLVSRIMKLSETYVEKRDVIEPKSHGTIANLLSDLQIQKAIEHVWAEIGALDGVIQSTKPWETKDGEAINQIVVSLSHIAHSLSIFMPKISEKILEAITENKKPKNLFPRLNA